MSAEALDTSHKARQFMHTAPTRMAGASLFDALLICEKIEDLYGAFPEFELEFPKEQLASAIEAACLEKTPHLPGLLLLFCVSLAPENERFTAALLKSMAERAGLTGLMDIARIIAAAGGLRWAQIMPAIDVLKRRSLDHESLEVTSLVLKSSQLRPGLDATRLGQFLKDLALEDPASREPDPLALAKTASLAASRLGPIANEREAGLPEVGLLDRIDRLARKFGDLPPPPPFEVPLVQRITSGRFRFPEFALMSDGMKADWLPFMATGLAGERHGQGVRSLPGVGGHMVFGPYFRLRSGPYRVLLKLDVSGRKRNFSFRKPKAWAALDVVAGDQGSRCLAFMLLETSSSGRQEFFCNFAVPVDDPEGRDSGVEIRLWTDGSLTIDITAVLVERLGEDGMSQPKQGR